MHAAAAPRKLTKATVRLRCPNMGLQNISLQSHLKMIERRATPTKHLFAVLRRGRRASVRCWCRLAPAAAARAGVARALGGLAPSQIQNWFKTCVEILRIRARKSHICFFENHVLYFKAFDLPFLKTLWLFFFALLSDFCFS